MFAIRDDALYKNLIRVFQNKNSETKVTKLSNNINIKFYYIEINVYIINFLANTFGLMKLAFINT